MDSPEEFYAKMMEVGLMSKETARRLTGMKGAIEDARKELRDHEGILQQHAEDGQVWDEVLAERNDEMEEFQMQVTDFARVKAKWEEAKLRQEKERQRIDEERANREVGKAKLEEERRLIEVDRQRQRYTTLDKHLQAIVNQQHRQNQLRVDYTQRLQVVSNKRDTSWVSLNTAHHRKHTERMTEQRIVLDEEVTGALPQGTSLDELSYEIEALRNKAGLLETKVRTLQTATDRKEGIINTRKMLQNQDVEVAFSKCDEMLQRAEEAKQSLTHDKGDASDTTSTSTAPADHMLRAPKVPTTAPHLAVCYGTPLCIPDGTALPPVTVSLFDVHIEEDSDISLTLCPADMGVTLIGQLTLAASYLDTTAVFSEVVVKASPGAVVKLVVTALLPEGTSVCTPFEVRIHHTDVHVVVTKHDVSFVRGTVPLRVHLGNDEYVVPPNGVVPRLGNMVRCLDPLMVAPLHEGLESSGAGAVWEDALRCTLGDELLGVPRLHDIKIDPVRGLVGCHEEGVLVASTGVSHLAFLIVVMFAMSEIKLAAYGIKGSKPMLLLLDLDTYEQTQVPLPADITVTALEITRAGRVVVGSNNSVHVWDGPPMVPVAAYSIPKPTQMCCVAVRGDEVVIADTAGKLLVWAPPTVVTEVPGIHVLTMGVTPGGEVVTMGLKGLIRVYSPSLDMWRDIGVQQDMAGDIRVLPLDDTLCVVGGVGGVTLWDLKVRQVVQTIDCECFSFTAGLAARTSYFKPEVLLYFSSKDGVRQGTMRAAVDDTHGSPLPIRAAPKAQLSPCVEWSESDYCNLSSVTLDDTTPTARSLGFLKANNIPPPNPCTDEVMRVCIIEFITACKLSNRPYVDWWQLAPPPVA